MKNRHISVNGLVALGLVALLFGGAGQAYASMPTEIGGKVLPPGSLDSPIAYLAELFHGDTVAGSSAFQNIGSPGTWDYYSFYAVAGDTPVIDVHRTSSAMDPALTLFFGTTSDSAGLFPTSSTQAGMTFLAFRDDNNGIPHGLGGFFADPNLSGFSLPSTGFYTLAVYDFIGLGPGPTPYEIHIDGITPVPAPGAAVLAVIGLGFITRLRRRVCRS